MGIFYDYTDSTYIVDTVDDTIKTTVTASGDVVAYWIDDILRIHRRRLHHLIVGVDLEWCPHGFHGTYGENPVALLQLCVGRRCLVFQLLHCDYIPGELCDFLVDSRFRFVGVGIANDLEKLQREYGLQLGYVEDLREIAAFQMGWPEIRQWGLQTCKRGHGSAHGEAEVGQAERLGEAFTVHGAN